MGNTNRISKKHWATLTLMVTLFLISGCADLIARYDQHAIEITTELKAEYLTLLENPPDSYPAEAAEDIRLKLRKAYEYSKARENNGIVTAQWEIMLDPDRSLAIGFLDRWKREVSMSPAFIEGFHQNISDGFDQIIALENGLNRAN